MRALYLSGRQVDILEQWDSGLLRAVLNEAIAASGHGRIQSTNGKHLDIGGSTGGASRRIRRLGAALREHVQ